MKIGIVGIGYWGKIILRNLESIGKTDVVLCDITYPKEKNYEKYSVINDYPREGDGFVYPARVRGTTICRDITSWSLVMEPEVGRLWVSDTQLPGCQGQFLAFGLLARQRLPDLDLASTGYQPAAECARWLAAGNRQEAKASLAQAIALDGPTAPHMLVKAILHGLAGEETQTPIIPD